MSRSSCAASTFAIKPPIVFWTFVSILPSAELPAPPAGQLSGVSISVGSLCVPSSAFCWHHSQALSNAAPFSVSKSRNPWSRIRGSACWVIRLSMLGGKSGLLAAGVPGLPSPRLTQSMVLAAAPMICVSVLRLYPQPLSLLGSAIFCLIKSQSDCERWGVSPRGHSRPCEVHSATVSSTFRSKRAKNPAVLADGSSVRPRKSTCGARHCCVSRNAVNLLVGPSSSIVRSNFSNTPPSFSSRYLWMKGASPIGTPTHTIPYPTRLPLFPIGPS